MRAPSCSCASGPVDPDYSTDVRRESIPFAVCSGPMYSLPFGAARYPGRPIFFGTVFLAKWLYIVEGYGIPAGPAATLHPASTLALGAAKGKGKRRKHDTRSFLSLIAHK